MTSLLDEADGDSPARKISRGGFDPSDKKYWPKPAPQEAGVREAIRNLLVDILESYGVGEPEYHIAIDDPAVIDILAALSTAVDGLIPVPKTLETDLDEDNIGDFEDATRFCVECGQYEIEGQLNCKCTGYNAAIAEFQRRRKGLGL